MNHTPLEDDLRHALHRRVDPLQRSPLSVTDVRRRAHRIQRRRTLGAGAAVVAALAIAIPAGLAMNGTAERTEIPPVTQTPQVVGTVRIDPRSAPVGEGPRVTLVNTTGPTLVVGDKTLALPSAFDQITPFRDGWIATVKDGEGVTTVQFLDQDLDVTEFVPDASELTVAADASRVAFTFHDGNRWIVVDDRTAGEQTTPLPDGPYDSYVSTLGLLPDGEVLAYQIDQVDGTITTFVADGAGIEPLPWIDTATSASPVTGMIGGRTTDADGRSCGAVFDGLTRSPDPLWTDCRRSLSDFSPDGTLVAAFEIGDLNSEAPSRRLWVLDAATGESVIDFEVAGGRNSVVAVKDRLAWEDDRTLLATIVHGNQQYVVRLGLDGTVERVAGPVVNDYSMTLRLTPGTGN